MATLHFFGGEKGGVGKSFVTRTAVQYHLDRGIDFALFDADDSNADVKRIYKNCGCRDAIFSESDKYEDKAFALFEEAQKKTTLVNLPSHVIKPFKSWFEENDLFELAEENGVEYTIWFICSGGYDSYQHFADYLNYFQGKVNHVLVKNWGLCNEWESLEKNKFLQQKISEYGVKVIDFPEFKGKACRNMIDEQSLTFGVARESKEFALIDRQRIKNFSKRVYRTYDDAGVFYRDIKVQKAELTSAEIEEVKPTGLPKVSELIKKQSKVKTAALNGQADTQLEQFSELV